MRLWVPGWGRGLVSLPGGGQCPLRATVVQEVHVDIDDTPALIGDCQPTAPVEGAHRGGFDFFGGTHGQQGWQVLCWDGHHDAFLGFGKPNFPWLQPGVFEWDGGQLDPCAGLLPHFADC